MKFLVSPLSLEEAKSCVKGGADIVDVKNPKDGSLGGHAPHVIKEIRQIVPKGTLLSAAIGDIQNKPGLVAQAALGVASCGVDFVKFGLCDSFSVEEAIYLVAQTVLTLKDRYPHVTIVVCGYADAEINNIISPMHVPTIVSKSGAHVAMIDTLTKENGRRLFDYMPIAKLKEFSDDAHAHNVQVALAGRLSKEDIVTLQNEHLCDIVGIRTLACKNHERHNDIDADEIQKIKQLFRARE